MNEREAREHEHHDDAHGRHSFPRWVRGPWQRFAYGALRRIESLLSAQDHHHHHHERRPLNTTVTFQLGGKVVRLGFRKRTTMSKLSPVAIFSDQKIPLSVDPRLPNGDPDGAAVVSFASSDPSQVGVEVSSDDRSCFLTTPLDAGSATITISATGYESDTLELSYTAPVPRALNTAVGVPISDA